MRPVALVESKQACLTVVIRIAAPAAVRQRREAALTGSDVLRSLDLFPSDTAEPFPRLTSASKLDK